MWSAIQTGLHHMMSSIAVLAHELLGDHVKSCLEGRRAARLRQIPLDSPKRQLPAQANPTLGRAMPHLPLVQISLSSEIAKIRRMCRTTLKHASNLKCSLQIYRKHKHLRRSNCLVDFTLSPKAAGGLAFTLFGTNVEVVQTTPLCSKWPRSPSGSKPAFSVLL